MIEYQVRGTNFMTDEVRIDFRGVDEYNQISLSGYVPVTHAEFFQHSSSMEALAGLVKDKVTERLNNGEPSAVE